MRDEFAGRRLPDLPDAGYSTTKERALSDFIMQFLRNVERDRLYLLSVVIDGPFKFRHVVRKAWKHLPIDDDLCNAMFGYLKLLAGQNPIGQRDHLLRQKWLPQSRRIQ